MGWPAMLTSVKKRTNGTKDEVPKRRNHLRASNGKNVITAVVPKYVGEALRTEVDYATRIERKGKREIGGGDS